MTTLPAERNGSHDLMGASRIVRPVMLVTLNVPFDPVAVTFALDTAAEAGAELYVCDAIPLEYRNPIGHIAHQYAEQCNRRYLNEVVAQAWQRGVKTTQLAFHNPKPVRATIEVARTEAVGLLVFGPGRAHLGRWTFRRAARRLREGAPCLVWTNE